MGVRGLEKFILKNKKYCRHVEIVDIIQKWKSRNAKKNPIIVFDSSNMSFIDALPTVSGLYFSGELNKFDEALEKWLKILIDLKVELVFFRVWGIDEHKIDEWIGRQNKHFKEWINLYEMIDEGRNANEIFKDLPEVLHEVKHSLLLNVAPITSKHGIYKMGRVGHDTDQEIARYATEHEVCAVFARDTDFMIFDGFWKLWSYVGIDLDGLKVKEFDRLIINHELDLTFKQRPLLAALMGNGITQKYQDKLLQFHESLGRNAFGERFRKVALYIRDKCQTGNYSHPDDIKKIANIFAEDIFGDDCNDEHRQTLIDSIKSYDVKTESAEKIEEADPVPHEKLNIVEHCYNIKNTQALKMFYIRDESGEQSKQLNNCLYEMIRKQVGVINPDSHHQTFKLITKKSIEETYQLYDETPLFPNFGIPDDFNTSDELRWNVLAWLLSISEKHKNAIRLRCNKDLRVACATLLVLVQLNIFSTEVADSILVAEQIGRENRVPHSPVTEQLNADHVAAALCYKSTYMYVLHAFETARLTDEISELFKFDVIFFQNLMATNLLDTASIAMYRIYDD